MHVVRMNQKQTVDLDRIARVAGQLKELVEGFSKLFPEREHLLKQILYALIVREHVLVYGTFGTGKSDLLGNLFGAFEGAETFSVAFSKFMTEANVIGIPHPGKMREEGVVHYSRDGGMLDADFAELDELFDSSEPLLRVLLGILNERTFKRGRQVEKAELHTAVACTNGDPKEEVQKNPKLGAVVDRFIFQCKVAYLAHEDSRVEMYEKHLRGLTHDVTIQLDDLKFLSSVCLDGDQIGKDDYLLRVFDRVVQAFVDKSKKVVSDRRRCKLLQLIEANALLNGRYEVSIEDIEAIRWGLCLGGSVEEHKIFDETCLPMIQKAAKERPQNVDDVQIGLLAQIEVQMPKPPAAKETADQLLARYRLIKQLRTSAAAVRPQLPSTLKRRDQLVASLETVERQALEQIGKE